MTRWVRINEVKTEFALKKRGCLSVGSALGLNKTQNFFKLKPEPVSNPNPNPKIPARFTTLIHLVQRFSNHGSPRLYEWVADTSRALSTLVIFNS